MRISPALLLLPVLVLSGACTQTVPSAIANDDRPASPQPAIVSPVPAPLTIESLAGTYKGVVDEKELKKLSKKLSNDLKRQGMGVTVELFEANIRLSLDQLRVTINPDGTFESRVYEEQRGKVKLDGNKLIFTNGSDQLIDGIGGSTNSPKCAQRCMFTLYISADGKSLLIDYPKNSPQLLRGFVKQ